MLATISNMEKNPSGPGFIHMRWHTRNIDSERCVQDTGSASRACDILPACYKKKAVRVRNRSLEKQPYRLTYCILGDGTNLEDGSRRAARLTVLVRWLSFASLGKTLAFGVVI